MNELLSDEIQSHLVASPNRLSRELDRNSRKAMSETDFLSSHTHSYVHIAPSRKKILHKYNYKVTNSTVSVRRRPAYVKTPQQFRVSHSYTAQVFSLTVTLYESLIGISDHTPRYTYRCLISQANICGFSALHSRTRLTTSGVVTFGLLPPI